MTYPIVPLVNQWTDGEEVSAAKLFTRVDNNFNLIRNAILNPPRFKGSIIGAVALTLSTPVPYPVIFDTAGGWSVGTSKYTVQLAGTYSLSVAGKWGTAPGATTCVSLILNGSTVVISPDAPNVSFSGPSIATTYRFATNDIVWVTFNHSFTTQNDGADNNYLTLTWTGV